MESFSEASVLICPLMTATRSFVSVACVSANVFVILKVLRRMGLTAVSLPSIILQ